ncbi:MAG: hypothetical protein JST02_04915 [Bacteroidetes bacterium]|nr:hypothetical protein [Bacteroidota bacterium]
MYDIIEPILWMSMFLTPVITVPVIWKRSKERKILRLATGLILAIILSGILFLINWYLSRTIQGLSEY